jgi:hypothetical protein
MTTRRTLLAAAVSLAAVRGAASARDFPQMDISGWCNGQVQPQNAHMNNMQEQIIQQNMANPQIAAMCKHIVAGGQSHGDLRTFACTHPATGGFRNTRRCYETSNRIVNNEPRAWSDFQGAVRGCRDAYGNYAGGF